MKIIIPGKTPRERINGMTQVCLHCDCKVEVTSEDILKEITSQRDGNSWAIECPTNSCGKILYFIDPRNNSSYR